MLAAIYGCFAGITLSRPEEKSTHLFRISFFFLFSKIYIELCVSSQYRFIKNKNQNVQNISMESNVPHEGQSFVGQSDV